MLRNADPQAFSAVYVVCGYTDMRLGIDSLATIIQSRYQLPVFEAFIQHKGQWVPMKKKLYGGKDKQLHKWHFFANCSFNELLPKEDRKTIAFLRLYKGQWVFYNIGMKDLTLVVDGTPKSLQPRGYTLLKIGMEFRNNEPNGLSLKVINFL